MLQRRGFIFLGEGENWREGDFFWSFLEGCFLEEKNLDSFAEEYPFSLAGKRKEKKGLRGETREGSFLSSFWREDIFEKETREREKNRRDFCLRKERKMRIAEEVY